MIDSAYQELPMRRSARIFFAVLSAALPILAASVQTAKPEQTGFSSERLARIHDMVQRHMDAHDISGAVTLVARNGKIAHFEAHGLADVEANKTMSRSSLFWIMSMTKPVVGTSVLMLMEEGKLRLTDPVSKFIPEFKDPKVAVMQDRPAGAPAAAPGTPPLFYTVPATRELTIQDLLTHVNGLMTGGQASRAEEAKISLKAGEKLSDYIPRLATTPLDFQPGTRWQYSATAAWDTLERVVEIVSGEPFDRFARERIFEPLGMQDTGWVASPEQLQRIAKQYRGTSGTLTRVETKPIWMNNPAYFSGGGGLMSSAEDTSSSVRCWPIAAN
jgi:CubicO group peptidase (beta-lactamase class C family)